jgi:ABC-type glycerol-3-phosphate transport system substrate-binding protein
MIRIIALLVAAALAAGCMETPTSPASVNPPVPTPLTVSHVSPKEGWAFYYTQVFGTGFTLTPV